MGNKIYILISIIISAISFSIFAQVENNTGNTMGIVKPKPINIQENYAIAGYDVVAYHTKAQAIQGSSKIMYKYNNATWLFVSMENLALFKTNPEKYLPEYGGFCAYAMARGYQAEIDPEAWTIYKGKLYLNYSKSVRRTWKKNKDEEIANADIHWSKL